MSLHVHPKKHELKKKNDKYFLAKIIFVRLKPKNEPFGTVEMYDFIYKKALQTLRKCAKENC